MYGLKDWFKSILSYSQPELSLTNIKENMEAARLQLEAYSVTLTELVNKMGKYCRVFQLCVCELLLKPVSCKMYCTVCGVRKAEI